jgi:GNAT superfamily N-acetyltransferase
MKFLTWDSDFFNIPSYLFEDEKDLENLPNGFITAKIDVNNQRLINELLKKGFYFVNIEVGLEYVGKKISYNNPNIFEISDNKELDYEKLGSVFKFTRFHIDKYTSNKADLLWIEYLKNFKPNEQNRIYAIKDDDRIEGVFLVKENCNLFFVSVIKQNIGLGSNLMNFLKSKYEYIITETQLNNPAINFYIKNGFKIKENRMVLHRWENR